jgi:hypothetical protein
MLFHPRATASIPPPPTPSPRTVTGQCRVYCVYIDAPFIDRRLLALTTGLKHQSSLQNFRKTSCARLSTHLATVRWCPSLPRSPSRRWYVSNTHNQVHVLKLCASRQEEVGVTKLPPSELRTKVPSSGYGKAVPKKSAPPTPESVGLLARLCFSKFYMEHVRRHLSSAPSSLPTLFAPRCPHLDTARLCPPLPRSPVNLRCAAPRLTRAHISQSHVCTPSQHTFKPELPPSKLRQVAASSSYGKVRRAS